MLDDSEPPLLWPRKTLLGSAVKVGVKRPSAGLGDAGRDSVIGAETGVGSAPVEGALDDADLGVVRSGIEEAGV
jgi:hypothetical protein